MDRIDPDSDDAIRINQMIEDINNRWDKLQSQLGERGATLGRMLELSAEFYKTARELGEWLPEKTDFLNGLPSPAGSQSEIMAEQRVLLKVVDLVLPNLV